MGSYRTVTVDTTVDVDVDLDDFDDDDLIEEMEERGFKVLDADDNSGVLDKFDIQTLINIIGEQKIGSELWCIKEKLYSLIS